MKKVSIKEHPLLMMSRSVFSLIGILFAFGAVLFIRENMTYCTKNKIDNNNNYDDDEKVQIELYYESQCPGCRQMITEIFYEAYDAKKFLDMVDITYVPYGNAEESGPDDNGKYNFDCQHGESECVYNVIEACALEKIECNYKKFYFIDCIENNDDSRNVTQDYYRISMECAKETKLDDSLITAIKECVTSDEGNALEHKMAIKTDSLDPPHKFVPYIVTNGVHDDDVQNAITEKGLLKYVCDTYKGPKKSVDCPADDGNNIKGDHEDEEDEKEDVTDVSTMNVCYRNDDEETDTAAAATVVAADDTVTADTTTSIMARHSAN